MNKKSFMAIALASAFSIGTIGAAFAPLTTEASGNEKSQEMKGQYGYEINKSTDDKFKDKPKKADKIDLDSKFVSQFADVDGNQIHYKIYEGKKNPKKTFVITHGATATLETTKTYAKAVAEQNPDARILIVDLPLHGKSTSEAFTAGEVSLDKYAEIMGKFIEQKRDDGTIKGKLNYAGWSMGGSIAMKLVLAGAPIDELVLINTSPVWESIEGLKSVLGIEAFTPEIVSMMTAGNYNEETANGMDFDTYMQTVYGSPVVGAADFNALAVDAYDIREQLNQIGVKTLIFSGTQDELALPQMQALMDESIPASKLVMYENGHEMLMEADIAKEMAKELNKYFDTKGK